jgi:hypothetical protein
MPVPLRDGALHSAERDHDGPVPVEEAREGAPLAVQIPEAEVRDQLAGLEAEGPRIGGGDEGGGSVAEVVEVDGEGSERDQDPGRAQEGDENSHGDGSKGG